MPTEYVKQLRKQVEARDRTPKKRDLAKVLARWQAMDEALGTSGVRVLEFAKKMRVSRQTVNRDLDTFESLGYEIGCGQTDKRLYHTSGKWIFVSNMEKHGNTPAPHSTNLFGDCFPRRHLRDRRLVW
jgi:hypothetical protein